MSNNGEMNLTSISVIKNLLKEKGVRPSKKMGQNFLVSKAILEKIVKAADLKNTDAVLEIGPGLGTLTQVLAKKAGKVITVEKDRKMTAILKKTLQSYKNIKIISGDILKIPLTSHLLPNTYKVVANLPYYITSPVIRKFLEAENPPCQMVLMIQKEVAQRIMASPSQVFVHSPETSKKFGRASQKFGRARPLKMNLLAISVQFYAKPEIISYVSKNSFWPPSQVNSAIIKIVPRYSALNSASFREQFFRIVKAGFSHPRKQLAKNLINELELERENAYQWLLKNQINPIQRAETLNLQDWLNLAKTSKNIII